MAGRRVAHYWLTISVTAAFRPLPTFVDLAVEVCKVLVTCLSVASISISRSRPSDKKLPVFLALDSDNGYVWGDAGTAQIFYRMADTGPEFSFDWSCY